MLLMFTTTLMPYHDIKPCPFCGGDSSPNCNWRDTWVECDSCDARGTAFLRRDLLKAVQAWNSRSSKKRLTGQIHLQLTAPIPPKDQNYENI